MAFLPVGFIDGETVNAETLRRAFWIANQGATGVAQPDDLKVTQLSVPGAGVLIAPGGAVVTTAFQNAPTIQSYTLANDATVQLNIPGNSTGSNITYYIIARVSDPQYAGEPAATNYLPIIEAVTSLPVAKPYLLMATAVMRANTATITDADITDKRKLARARKVRNVVMKFPGVDKVMSTASYITWPLDDGVVYVDVPIWARTLKVIVTISGIETTASSAAPAVGGITTSFAGAVHPQNGIVVATSNGRQTFTGAWQYAVGSSLRGQNVVRLDIKARRTSAGGNFVADYQSTIVVDYEFSEE